MLECWNEDLQTRLQRESLKNWAPETKGESD